MNTAKIVLIFMLFSLIARCQNGSFDLMLKGLLDFSADTLHTSTLKDWMQQEKDFILVDAREEEEYQVSHIPGAVHVGYEQIKESDLDRLPRDKPIVVYCSVGYRSEKIAKRLQDKRPQPVYNLYGGVFEWVNEGNRVVNLQHEPTQKVHAYNKTWGIWLKRGEKVYKYEP